MRGNTTLHKSILLALHCICWAPLGVLAMAGVASAQMSNTQASEAVRAYDIPAGSLSQAVNALSRQSGVQVIYDMELLKGKRAIALKGQHSLREALARVLAGSGLEWSWINPTTIVVRKDPNAKLQTAPELPAKTPPPGPAPQTSAQKDKVVVMPAIMVTGKRGWTLNTDIERTRDDTQPYIVFDREKIEQSGAINLEDFLKKKLTANTTERTSSQVARLSSGSSSEINLRGLGANQTLVLIDGHRAVGSDGFGTPRQPDLNAIPLAAIERIEVLASTASGIYGGTATGGVVNIVMRRDYQGVEAKLTYGNTFDTDVASRRMEVSGGFNFGEKTNLLLSASYSDQNSLMQRDRDFEYQARLRLLRNRPDFILPPSSPPLGYTANLRSLGGNLVLDNGTPLNASFTSVPIGYAGPATDGGAALVTRAGQYNLELANSAQTTFATRGGKQSLLNVPTVKTVSATVRHAFTPRLRGFLDMMASDTVGHASESTITSTFTMPADSPENPFQQDIEVAVPLTSEVWDNSTYFRERRLVGGVIIELPRAWQAEADYTWHRSRTLFTTAPSLFSRVREDIGSGALSLPLLRDTNAFPIDLMPYLAIDGETRTPGTVVMRDATLRASGPIGSLPGGPITLSSLIERRDESLDAVYWFDNKATSPLVIYYPDRSQTISSVSTELRLPLVSANNKRKGIEELELQVAARHERNSIHGVTPSIQASSEAALPFDTIVRATNRTHSTDPTIGLRYMPIADIALRASYGTGFLAPTVSQLARFSFLSDTLLPQGNDPRRGGEEVLIPARNNFDGGNPDLRPEKSESWSVGLILTPRQIPDLRLSVDYTQIKKTDEITTHPGGSQGLINDEELLPGRITRGPNLPGDPPGWPGPIIGVDNSLLNLSQTQVAAYDLQIDYQRDTAIGRFALSAAGTWIPYRRNKTREGDPTVDSAGFYLGPLKFKANAGVTWSYRSWTVGWATTFFDGYKPYIANDSPDSVAAQIMAQGASRVPRQIYHDVFGIYRMNRVEVQAGVKNVFNTEPPLDMLVRTYSGYGDPRLANYYVSVKFWLD